MRRSMKADLFIAVILAVTASLGPGVAVGYDAVALPGEVQIKLREGVSIETIHERYGTQTQDSLPPAYLLRLPTVGDEEGWVDLLRIDPDIEEAECSWRSETPEGIRQMVVILVGETIEGYLDQGVLSRLRIPEVHEACTGAGVLVGVLDSGVLASHEALADCLAPGGWDFVDDDPDPTDEALGLDEDGDGTVDEGWGHGTMVTGLVHLLAPDARILPLRVLNDEGTGRVFDVAKAMRYAVEQGVQVINLSLGLVQHTFVIQDEILRAGEHSVAVVCGAGNLATESPAFYPALDPQALSVAAVDSSDIKAEFSNWHRSVDLSAPGVGILAPFADGGYAIGAGTSFSTPFVTAQCAWIREARPDAGVIEIYRIAREGVLDIYDLPENEPYLGELGTGRIDGLESLRAIQGESGPASTGEASRTMSGLVVLPNPSREGQEVWLHFPDSIPGSTARITVYDLRGRRVGDSSWKGGPGDLPLSLSAAGGRAPLPGGIYFVKVEGSYDALLRIVRLR